jgi:hypothetical protein
MDADGFSPAPITSLCASISNRVIVSIEELSTVAAATRHEGLASLLGLLNGLNRAVQGVDAALRAAAVLSQGLQTQLNHTLAACDGAVAVSQKQLMRIEPGNVHAASKPFLAPHYDFLAAHVQSCVFFQEVLKKYSIVSVMQCQLRLLGERHVNT